MSGGNAPKENLEIRRSIIAENYNDEDGSGHRQGIYTSSLDGLFMEENLFYKNGWKEGVHTGTIFNHNIYLAASTRNVRLYRNINAEASSHGIQYGGGGLGRENIFVRNPINVLSSRGSGGEGFNFTFENNIILEAERYIDRDNQTLPRGFGLEVGDLNPEKKHVVSGNILSGGLRGRVLRMIGGDSSEGTGSDMAGVNNLNVFDNIIYSSRQGLSQSGSSENYSNCNFYNNLIQIDGQSSSERAIDINTGILNNVKFTSNTYFSANNTEPFRINGAYRSFDEWQNLSGEKNAEYEKVDFFDPDRNIGSYQEYISNQSYDSNHAAFEAFINKRMKQSRNNWDWEYHPVRILEYFQEGFTVLSEPESIKISGPEELKIPVSGEKNRIYSVKIMDENGTVLKDEPYTAEIVGNPHGAFLAGTRLTVTPRAEPGDIVIEVELDEYEEISNEITVTLLYHKTAPDEALPERSFVTPSNPELKFGEEAKEVLITDIRGNEVFREEKGSSRFIIWSPGEGGTVSIESGIYIYRIKTKDGYEYGSVVVAK